MRPTYDQSAPATAILTLAEIKAATEAFDRGESNVFDIAWRCKPTAKPRRPPQ